MKYLIISRIMELSKSPNHPGAMYLFMKKPPYGSKPGRFHGYNEQKFADLEECDLVSAFELIVLNAYKQM